MHSLVSKKRHVRPNLALITSVILLLTVVFVAFTPLFIKQLPLALTRVTVVIGSGVLPSEQVVIRVGTARMTLNGIEIEEAALSSALRSLLVGRSHPSVMLDADSNLSYERVIALLELCRAAGATSVGFAPDLAELVPVPREPTTAEAAGSVPVDISPKPMEVTR